MAGGARIEQFQDSGFEYTRAWRNRILCHKRAVSRTFGPFLAAMMRPGSAHVNEEEGRQGNRVKISCGDEACEKGVVPSGDFAFET